MKINLDSEQSIAQQLLDHIDVLSQLYMDLFVEGKDIKALQGVERCIDMCLKICGIDGKHPLELATNHTASLCLADFPADLLEQISNHIKQKQMQQQ